MVGGLDDVVAAETRLSHVDGGAGRLLIAGHDVEDLAAGMRFEDVAALLWRDLAPQAADAAETGRQLGAARRAAADMLPRLSQAAGDLSPIEGLRAGLAMLADHDDGRDHVRVTAAIPVFMAALSRRARGLAPVMPDPRRGQAADFLHMLHDREPDPAHVAALDTYLVTVSDHGMNASTFTARVAASTRAGTVSSVVAALCALKGPLHGGAPGPVLDMLDGIGAADRIDAWLDEQLAAGARLMGFGHRVYRTRDPRADVLKRVVRGLRTGDNRIAFAEQVECAAIAKLAARYPDRRLDTNVEFYTALALEAVGLPRDLFTCLFAMGRVLGWTAHIFEQVATNRIMRPRSSYVGPWPDGRARAVAGG